MNEPSQMLAIVGATVIDGNGGAPIKDGVILIEGRSIVDVGNRSTQIPSHAKRIEATGKFVVPGLVDSESHLVDGTDAPTLIRYEGRYEEVAIETAQIALKYGVTTIFDPWGPRDPLIKVRDAISAGRVTGSRIYVGGNIVGYGGPFSVDMRPKSRWAVPEPFAARVDALWEQNVGRDLTMMALDEVRERIRVHVHSGIDFLTVGVTTHFLHGDYGVSDGCQFLVFSPRVLHMIVEEAHLAGLPVNVFGPSTNEAVLLALEAGVDLSSPINIGELGDRYVLPETVALMAQRQFPCGLIFQTNRVLELWRRRTKSNPSLNVLFNLRDLIDRNVQTLLDGGAVPMLRGGYVFSADTLSDWVAKGAILDEEREGIPLGGRYLDNLLGMQDKGMEPMAIVMAATRNVAKAYKTDKLLGTLERGKFADLLILDRNPLDDADNYRSISVLMKDGAVIDRDALPTQRLVTAPSMV